ncbi:MAG: DNA recombination protein RmuC, partial [Firmicutes bacterium]|nr:DNA recombination protein RmuC [Bacillota bacterium]
IQQNAGEVWRVLGSVRSEFDKFAEVLDTAQHQIDQANKSLDKLVGTRTRAIQRTLKDVQRLGDLPQDAENDLLI